MSPRFVRELHPVLDADLATEDDQLDVLTREVELARERQLRAERTLRDITEQLLQRAREAERERDALRREVATRLLIVDPPPPPRRRRSPVDDRRLRAVLLIAFAVGTLAVLDAFLSIVWQEPLTGLLASRAQGELTRDLAASAAAFALPVGRSGEREPVAARVRRVAGRLLGSMRAGQALGELSIPRIGLRTTFLEGTATKDLRRGPGHYRSTMLPGLPGTTAIAGHRTTFGAPFRHIDRLQRGDRIVIRMPYRRFIYEVRGSRTVAPTAVGALRRRTGPGRLLLTACDPPGSAARRLLVWADRV